MTLSRYLTPNELTISTEYLKGYSIAEAMPVYGMGIPTGPEQLTIASTPAELEARLTLLASTTAHTDIRRQFNLYDSASFSLRRTRLWAKKEKARHAIIPCTYRAFDNRYIIYSSVMIPRLQWEVFRHLISGNSLALVTTRASQAKQWSHAFITNHVVPKDFLSTQDSCFVFPLYLYNAQARLNFNAAFINEVSMRLGLAFKPESSSSLLNEGTLPHISQPSTNNSFTPEDVLAYIYAVLHCPTYRQRYNRLLTLDFPRIPLTQNIPRFRRLVELGQELLMLHLLDMVDWYEHSPRYPVAGRNDIWAGYPKFISRPSGFEPSTTLNRIDSWDWELPPPSGGLVYINDHEYFEGISSEAWNFEIGGYRPIYHWLNQRTGQSLDPWTDIPHYRHIAVVVRETLRLMQEIETAIPSWPLT